MKGPKFLGSTFNVNVSPIYIHIAPVDHSTVALPINRNLNLEMESEDKMNQPSLIIIAITPIESRQIL